MSLTCLEYYDMNTLKQFIELFKKNEVQINKCINHFSSVTKYKLLLCYYNQIQQWNRVKQILKLRFQYFSHLIRREDSLEKPLMLGKCEGKKRGDDRGLDGWTVSSKLPT